MSNMMLRTILSLLAVSVVCFAAPSTSHNHLIRAAQPSKSTTYGGPGGSPFDDSPELGSNPKVASITVTGNKRLDAISFTMASGKTLTHGGEGGIPRTVKFEKDEYITFVKLCWGPKKKNTGSDRIHYIFIKTSTDRAFEKGLETWNCKDISAPKGLAIVGAHGRSANEVDQLGFIFAPRV